MDDILSQVIAYAPNRIDTETKARAMVQGPRNMYNQGQLVQPNNDGSRPGYKPGGIVEPGVEYYGKLTEAEKKANISAWEKETGKKFKDITSKGHKWNITNGKVPFSRVWERKELKGDELKNVLDWGKNKSDGKWSKKKILEEYNKKADNTRAKIRIKELTGTSKSLKKLSTKEVQALYKDLPENVSIQVQKRGKNKIPEYTFRAKVSGKNVGKENWTMNLGATPENKTKIIEETQKVLDEYHPNRLSREDYAELRLKPENKRLKGEDFAKKLNDAGYTTYAGDEWARENVYNYDKETPRSSKKLAKDLGFFEKRTVAEAKDIINQYSGGKHFLKNKNLTDTQITTRAAEYVAMEKNIEKTGGTYSFPRGKQTKRKVWQNIYSSHDQGGRFKLANADKLPKFEDGRINWRKDKAWRKAKFKDSKSGKIFTYGNLEEMVDKHGGGWKKAIKAYDDNAKLNQMTFKGKALNEWFREGMIKKEYEALIGEKVPFKDKGLQKYMGEKKPYYSFTEAHHFKGVKDHPFDTESSFRYANRRQGNFQNSYDKAIKSGDPDRIAQAKIKYAEDMKSISDDLGGIRFKMDDTRFVGTKGTEEGIIRTGAKVSGMSEANQIKLFKQLGYRCRKEGGGGESVACYMSDVEKTRADMKSQDVTVRAKALTKQRKALQVASKLPQIGKIIKTGVQLGTAAITKPLQWLGLTSGIGYAIEGVVEGVFYDNARRKGYNHQQAMAETLTPGLIAGRPEGVPWYGGAEALREKELYEVRGTPKILDDGTIQQGEVIPGKVQPKVKQYTEALKDQQRVYDAFAEKNRGLQASRPDIADPASADIQDLYRSGTISNINRIINPESMASQAYNTAVEKRDALDQRRKKEYLEKYDPQALEREKKSFDIYVRDKDGNILYEKMNSRYKKRYKDMEKYKKDRKETFGFMTPKDWEKYQTTFPKYKNIPYEHPELPKFADYMDFLESKPEGYDKTYEELFPTPASRYDWDLLGEVARAGGVANMATGGRAGYSEGGITTLRSKYEYKK